MKPDEFEQKLSRQPLSSMPGEWRAEILAAAREAQASRHSSFVIGHSWLPTLKQAFSALLWPHPKAWAGLAAVWLGVIVLNCSLRDPSPGLAAKAPPPSPETVAELRQQQRMLAELIGPAEERVTDRRRELAPKPRSERVEIVPV